jgi:hypothetical protein
MTDKYKWLPLQWVLKLRIHRQLSEEKKKIGYKF